MPRDTGVHSRGAGKRAPKGTQRVYKPSPTPSYTPRPSVAPRPDVTMGGDKKRLTGKRNTTGYDRAGTSEKQALRTYERTLAKREKYLQGRANRGARRVYAKQDRKTRLALPFTPESRYAHNSFYVGAENLAEQNLRFLHKSLWKHLGFKGKAPKIKIDFSHDGPTKNYGAYVYRGENTVNVREPMLFGQQYNSKRRKNYFRGALVHEDAHTRQSPKTQRSKANVEGGADNFAIRKAPKAYKAIGVKGVKYKGSFGYGKYRRKARKKGSDWTLRGQFG